MSAAPSDVSDTGPAGLVTEFLCGPQPEAILAGLACLHASAFPRGWSADELGVLLKTPGCAGFTARTDETVPGFLLFRSAGLEAEILTLAVAPGWRRRGIGRRLTEALVAWTAGNGIGDIHLEVACDNAPAVALYRQLGFREAGRRRGYYSAPNGQEADGRRDALRMRLGRRDVSQRRGVSQR